MPRVARYVAPGVAHHITQRGTARQLVFLTRADRLVYLELLREKAAQAGVSILSYCLMPNHVHLIAVPAGEDSLAILLRRVHGRYAQYFNARKLRQGHLWQNRFYSCPLGPSHLWMALRYVELNPVRARMVAEPTAFEWSSAQAHCGGIDRHRLLDTRLWEEAGGAVGWRMLLDEPVSDEEAMGLRKATHAGQPIGDEEFRRLMEQARKARRQFAQAANQ
jgi:putative transposase